MHPSPDRDFEAELLALGGGDPFDDVLRASDDHRGGHPGCRLYPAGPRVMSIAAQIVRISQPMRILDLGSGLGYSTLWLAAAAPPTATIVGIDRDAEHAALAREFARDRVQQAGVRFIVGDVATAVAQLDGPYDFVHDDAWFASKPAHFERILKLLRPGGVLTMPNWFLLAEAFADRPRRDWAEFAGPGWRDAVREFATDITDDDRLRPVWVGRPPMLIALRTEVQG